MTALARDGGQPRAIAQHPHRVDQVVEGCGLATLVADLTVESQRAIQVAQGACDIAQQPTRHSEVIQRTGFAWVIVRSLIQCDRLLVVVDRLLPASQSTVNHAKIGQYPGFPAPMPKLAIPIERLLIVPKCSFPCSAGVRHISQICEGISLSLGIVDRGEQVEYLLIQGLRLVELATKVVEAGKVDPLGRLAGSIVSYLQNLQRLAVQVLGIIPSPGMRSASPRLPICVTADRASPRSSCRAMACSKDRTASNGLPRAKCTSPRFPSAVACPSVSFRAVYSWSARQVFSNSNR